jgi:glycosyltransferase involved in cell wall biosynthesis
MRVVMVSKALIVGAYQRKAEEIARLGVDLTVLIPPRWGDRRGQAAATRRHTQGYTLKVLPVRFGDNFHLHHYPTLDAELAEIRPHVVHMDEEPYNLATWQGLRLARRHGAAGLFFTWQNIKRTYPPPFRWFERQNYALAPIALAGSEEAGAVLRSKGYGGQIKVIPQFGVDPDLFTPADASHKTEPFVIGYAGGLLEEKGIDLLLAAAAGLDADWQMRIAGEGAARAQLADQARTIGIAEQVDFVGRVESSEMPIFLRELDTLVLPSRTTPSWKEQFGRVLIEAMACAVPVVGSDSGEIPQVVSDAGLIFPEGNAEALRTHLQELADSPVLRQELGTRGRQRACSEYTMTRIAADTVQVYETLCKSASTPNF